MPKHTTAPHPVVITDISAQQASSAYRYKGTFKKAVDIAYYYGFNLLLPIDFSKEKLPALSANDRNILKETNPFINARERLTFIKNFLENKYGSTGTPALLCHIDASQKDVSYLKLEIIGISKSIAEAILLQTSLVILKEYGHGSLFVDVNNIGDKDSSAAFTRELTLYYKKHLNTLHAHCRQTFKKSVLKLLECENNQCAALKENAPKSLSYLSESSRQHFKEVLEYLEVMDVPYRLNSNLISAGSFTSKSVFEIRQIQDGNPEGIVLARGSRYDGLAKRMGNRKDVAAVGISMQFKKTKEADGYKKSPTVATPADVYLIQLGFEAKLKCLPIIELLRQANIPVHQSLNKDDLLGQLTIAERLKIPYTIIMGQKEVLERSVIVRNMNTRSQDTVLITNLIHYLKKIGIPKKI